MRPPFAIATRDELWIGGRCVESRLSHGVATESDDSVAACDDADPALIAAVEMEIESARTAAVGPVDRLRLVASSRRIGESVVTSTAITMQSGELSIVTSPRHVAADRMLLLRLASVPAAADAVNYRDLPLVWREGSAAVLLHEAIGHAAEQGHVPLAWPAWLSVRDEPEVAVDDAGGMPQSVDLTRGEAPQAFRRESFRDVPLRRMSRLVARQSGADLIMPATRIDIHLVAHGTYDTLTEELTLRVSAADLVEGRSVRRLPPFWIRERRSGVAASLAGATGAPQRYPGVVCSLEGHEVVVESFAPVVMTRFG